MVKLKKSSLEYGTGMMFCGTRTHAVSNNTHVYVDMYIVGTYIYLGGKKYPCMVFVKILYSICL